MSAIEGKLILDALDEIEEPARFMDIVDHIKDRNECPMPVKTIERTIQTALDAGVRYGFIQQDADFYYSEAQIIKKLDAFDSEEEESLEENECHIFRAPKHQLFDNLMGVINNPENTAIITKNECYSNKMQVDDEAMPSTSSPDGYKPDCSTPAMCDASTSKEGMEVAKTAANPEDDEDENESGGPKSKKVRKSSSNTDCEMIDSSDDPHENYCTECDRCKKAMKNRKRKARGSSRKRGCKCRR